MSALPALWPLYIKALRPKSVSTAAAAYQAGPCAEASSVLSAPTMLARYRQLCQLANSNQLPPCWPNVLAFGLQLRVLLQSPFPVIGLVHMRNHICQLRPILPTEPLDIKVRLAPAMLHAKGVVLPLITEVYSKDQLVWRQQACHLYRTRAPFTLPHLTDAAMPIVVEDSRAQSIRLSAEHLHTTFEVARGIGRRYGWLSGDINPIHLSDSSARLFGFKAALAHGMWTKARILGALASAMPAFEVSVNFSSPLLLPDTAHLHCQPSGEHKLKVQHFTLASPARQRLLLSGQLQLTE